MVIPFIILGFLAYANGQCTLPTLPSNFVAHDGSITVNTTSATSGHVSVSLGSLPFACSGQSGLEFYGSLTVSGVSAGMCFILDGISGTTSHMRFSFRTNETTISGSPVNARLFSVGSSTCNSGDRPDYERIMTDSSASMFTPITLPSALSKNFTYTVGAGSCGTAADNADGVTSSTALDFSTGSCTSASSVLGAGRLYCLSTMTLNGNNFIWFSDHLTIASATFYCGAYSTTGTGVSMTIVQTQCALAQTATSGGGAGATWIALSLVENVQSSGAGTLVPSFLLWAITVIHTRLS